MNSNTNKTALLILDVDGILNDHTYNKIAESNSILPSCVSELNKIIHETNCKILLSSAWRYIVLYKDMTLRGFTYMLRTHGVTNQIEIIGTTNIDIKDGRERASQVRNWLAKNETKMNIGRYCCVDDIDFGFANFGIPFVQTNGRVGLTAKEADEIIKILRG